MAEENSEVRKKKKKRNKKKKKNPGADSASEVSVDEHNYMEDRSNNFMS